MALLAKTVAERNSLTPRKRDRKNRRRRVVEESSDEESSLSEEEEAPSPPRKPKRSQRASKEKAMAKTKARGGFDVDDPYRPGMKFDVEWLQGKKATYNAARKRDQRTGTKEALADKVSGMKVMLKSRKAKHVNEDKIAELRTALERWEAC